MDPIKAVRLRALILFMRSSCYLTKTKCTLCNFTVDLPQKAKEEEKKKHCRKMQVIFWFGWFSSQKLE